MQNAIEQLTKALEKVKNRSYCTSVGIEVWRDFDGNPQTFYKGYSFDAGVVERTTLDAVVDRLNECNPAKRKREDAAKKREDAAKLEADAAALEAEAAKAEAA